MKPLTFSLYRSTQYQNRKTCIFGERVDVTDAASFAYAVSKDYSLVELDHGYRANENFLTADVLGLDNDNGNTDDPDLWLTPDDIMENYPDVKYCVQYSRNHMKPKDGKAARPKFHLLLPLRTHVTSPAKYKAMKSYFTKKYELDENAEAATQMFFGTDPPNVEWHDGELFIDDVVPLQEIEVAENEGQAEGSADDGAGSTAHVEPGVVAVRPAGETAYSVDEYVDALFHLSPKEYRKYGDWLYLLTSCKSAGIPMETAKRWSDQDKATDPKNGKSMEASEWPGWWKSLNPEKVGPGYLVGVAVDAGWTKPSPVMKESPPMLSDDPNWFDGLTDNDAPPEYGENTVDVIDRPQAPTKTPKPGEGAADTAGNLVPEAFSDVGQAKLFWERNKDKIRYCADMGWLYYNEGQWQRDELAVGRLLQEMTWKQQACARSMVIDAQNELLDAKAAKDKALIEKAESKLKFAQSFFGFTVNTQNSGKMNGTMKQAATLAAVKISELDSYCYLLNTDGGVVDLRSGKMSPHDPDLLLTKKCPVIPGNKGSDKWKAFLQDLTDNDDSMAEYLQVLCGMAAFGRVYEEKLFMVVGPGGNGKSTFFNAVSDCFGDYATGLPAKLLTTAWNRNEQNDYARLRGMRLAVAKEMDRNQRLSESTVKQLCSTDDVLGEFKYHDSFTYTPSHTAILFTNNLPTVSGMDDGIWRRLEQVPLLHKFSGTNGEVMNYRETLFNECAPSILTWIIDGAVKFEMAGHKLTPCEKVKNASLKYRRDNDLVYQFVQTKCYESPMEHIGSQKAYRMFTEFLMDNGYTWKPKSGAFKEMMENHGYKHGKDRNGQFYQGLRERWAGDPAPDPDPTPEPVDDGETDELPF